MVKKQQKKVIAEKGMKKQNTKKNEISFEKCVWAKLRFCPFWPVRICTAPVELKGRGKDKVCVFFFGSKNL